jgi:hypothetical protein
MNSDQVTTGHLVSYVNTTSELPAMLQPSPSVNSKNDYFWVPIEICVVQVSEPNLPRWSTAELLEATRRSFARDDRGDAAFV